MAQSIRAIFFNADESAASALRKQLTAISALRLVAELDEPSLLPHAVTQFPADVIIAHLDPVPDVVLECLAQLIQAAPDTVVFAISASTDGQLVLRAMRAGIRAFLVRPLVPEELAQALNRVVFAKPKVKEPGKLISVLSSVGGAGATTLAVNLAVELARLVGPDQKVALVDLDFRFGQVATLLDIHGQFTVADLCQTPEQLDPQMILKALVRHETGLHVLTRPHNFAQAEMITSAHCASVFTGLQEMCAYVVLDGPTRYDPGLRMVLDAADFNLMVLQLLVPSVRNVDRMVNELATEGFNPERIQFVCNRTGRESGLLEIGHVEQTLNRKMYVTIPDDWKSVSTSVNIGRPLALECERSKVRQAIAGLAQKIYAPEAASADESAQRGGLIGKLFKKAAKSSSDSAGPAVATPARA